MKDNINSIFLLFKNTARAEFGKLQMQKILRNYLAGFLGLGLTTITLIIFFDYKYSKIPNPAEILEGWHSALFQTIFTIVFAFIGSSQICREFEKGMIKNIVLTGVPLSHYLFSRLIVFFTIFSVIILLTYLIDTAGMLLYFGQNFDIQITEKGFILTILHLLQTLFLVMMFSSLLKKTIHAVAALLLYYLVIEKIIVKIVLSLTSILNFSEWTNFIIKHTPLQVLDNLENAYEWNLYLINVSIFIFYLCAYGSIIWYNSRNTQLGLINK